MNAEVRKKLNLQLSYFVKDEGNSYLCRDCDFIWNKIHELENELVLLKRRIHLYFASFRLMFSPPALHFAGRMRCMPSEAESETSIFTAMSLVSNLVKVIWFLERNELHNNLHNFSIVNDTSMGAAQQSSGVNVSSYS